MLNKDCLFWTMYVQSQNNLNHSRRTHFSVILEQWAFYKKAYFYDVE